MKAATALARESRLPIVDQDTRSTNRFFRETLVAPRARVVAQRFPGNVRANEFEDLLGAIWSHIRGCLTGPVQVKEGPRGRTVTFMGAARFIVDKSSGRVTVSQFERQDDKVVFVHDDKATVIDLPVRIDGFWLDAFLVPWRDRIADCLIDHRRPGPGPDWFAAIKLELQRAVRRSFHWYQVRCELRDALKLDPQILLWCRKGRPTYRNYVTHRFYNNTLSARTTFQKIQNDNPNLIWLFNFLRGEDLHPKGDQPIADMKAWLLRQGVSEAGWRLVANGKEQDFRHIIDFFDAAGGIRGRHAYLAKWVRMLGKLRRSRAVPRPLSGMFEHDTYDGARTEDGDRVRFRDVVLQPGVLRAILEEGERRLRNGSHRSFIQEDLVEVMTWLQSKEPFLDKNQLRQGWKYLATQTATWRVGREDHHILVNHTWESLLPETQIGQWKIVPLTDAWLLRREALSQRHCADQLINDCHLGNSLLFSVRNSVGKTVATIGIELKGMHWQVFGFRGFANKPVHASLLGLDAEVLRRYTDLWMLTVPASKPLPPEVEREIGISEDSACPYCGETDEECAHVVAFRDLDSGELVGGALHEAYEGLLVAIENEIRYAALNGEFRFAVNDSVRMLAKYIKEGFDEGQIKTTQFPRGRDLSDMIFEWLDRYCVEVNVKDWEFFGGAPGTATIYRCYWAREPASVVAWLILKFDIDPLVTELPQRGHLR